MGQEHIKMGWGGHVTMTATKVGIVLIYTLL